MEKKIEKPDVAPMKAAAAKAVRPAQSAAKIVSPAPVVTEDAPKKSPVKTVAEIPAASKPPTPSSSAKAEKKPTHAEIQTQAYFVAERRRELHLPGDEASDWIEAERQLLAGE